MVVRADIGVRLLAESRLPGNPSPPFRVRGVLIARAEDTGAMQKPT